MRQPAELKHDIPLQWSTGTGTQVWQMICAAIAGDLATIRQLVTDHLELVECSHAYRTPLYFAVRENKIDVARFLLERGANPVGLAVNDTLLQITQDRGYREMEQLLDETIHGVGMPLDAGERLAELIR
ncbi:MAG: ankyrin repeat domain-containing protein, partial [Planctomycetales bacterium]|nr:ankyrin repeat domain-containing protein [Planctomycetales bacterium]